MTRRAVTYASYLRIADLLSLQVERSSGPDGAEHDELLFIVIHQVYELWFKQLRHELGAVQRALEAGDTDMALHLLNRVLKILKTLVAQVDVLETMTPAPVPVVPRPARLGVGVPVGRLPRDRGDARLARPGRGRRPARGIRRATGDRGGAGRAVGLGLVPRATWPARGHARPGRGVRHRPETTRVQETLVAVYRGDPDAALVAERLVDLDEGVQEWRYRHVKMVERTIGTKRGTGGSSGVEYLRSTLFQPVFPDLWEIRSRL